MDSIGIVFIIIIVVAIWWFTSSNKKVDWTYICNKCGYKVTMNQQLKIFVCPHCKAEEIMDWRDGKVSVTSGTIADVTTFGNRIQGNENSSSSCVGTIGLICGILSAVGMILGFIPLLGALNWVNIPFAILGLILSAVGGSKSGIVLCCVAIFFGLIRLFLGGGLF